VTVANLTPKLGLIAPVDSDTFAAADYATTFGKLDAVPGVTIVPAYSGAGGLNTLSWGTNQHGRTVIQADNGAWWLWYNPSGSGTWKRINNIGLIQKTIQNADVSSAATSGTGILVVQSGNLSIPGGRSVQINCTLGLDNNSGANGNAAVLLYDNGALLKTFTFKVGNNTGSLGNSQSFDWYVNPGSTPSTHNYAVYARSISITGGTTTAKTSVLNVIEV